MFTSRAIDQTLVQLASTLKALATPPRACMRIWAQLSNEQLVDAACIHDVLKVFSSDAQAALCSHHPHVTAKQPKLAAKMLLLPEALHVAACNASCVPTALHSEGRLQLHLQKETCTRVMEAFSTAVPHFRGTPALQLWISHDVLGSQALIMPPPVTTQEGGRTVITMQGGQIRLRECTATIQTICALLQHAATSAVFSSADVDLWRTDDSGFYQLWDKANSGVRSIMNQLRTVLRDAGVPSKWYLTQNEARAKGLNAADARPVNKKKKTAAKMPTVIVRRGDVGNNVSLRVRSPWKPPAHAPPDQTLQFIVVHWQNLIQERGCQCHHAASCMQTHKAAAKGRGGPD